MSKERFEEIREAAESDLESFIRLVHPQRLLGSVHSEVIQWMTRPDAGSHQLVLLPRDHQKSALVAYRVAWELTKNPCLRIVYMSSTANLAVKQLRFIKDILTCAQYRKYWPDMVSEDESQREKWTETEIYLDHPKRKSEAIRDPAIFTCGLTSSITGLHCDIAVLDDVVVPENAYTEDGRDKVRTAWSFLASIEGTEGRQWVVGTRYYPGDLYNDLISIRVEMFGDDGELESDDPLYEVFQRQVETDGQFLWPKQKRQDGKFFGFDAKILAKKRAQYQGNLMHFRAQYYNDPHDSETIAIDKFQYYDRKFLSRYEGRWAYMGTRLNVFAAIDFAFSLRAKADFTSIVVVGCDAKGNYYVIDIERFKTDRISDYFEHILALHQKWDFRKIRAEVTVAQSAIVKSLKEDYIKPHGLALSIDEYRPSRVEGSKAERIEAILEPKYNNGQIWHYQGGNCQTLEEELKIHNPQHDDVKDALASAIDICIMPSGGMVSKQTMTDFWKANTNSRFGGF